MRDWIDYYKLLQVDRKVEPDVLEAAYKRLARKFHPDVNKNPDAEARMKLLNEAYSVLTDPLKRAEYDRQWEEQHKSPHIQKRESPARDNPADGNSAAAAKNVLMSYFTHLMNKNLKEAYELISSADKKRISQEEFLTWQGTVSKIFKLRLFNCETEKCEKNVKLGDTFFKESVDFFVVVSEHNTVMDRIEKDIVNKKVVFDGRNWRIYMGYQGVQPFIEKLESLTGLLAAKSVVKEFIENYSRLDIETGLCNRKGFIDQAEREALRHKRYGNVFTFLMFNIDPGKTGGKQTDAGEEPAVRFGRLLTASLRKLDIAGRWSDKSFIALLPETKLPGGVAAALKIKRLLSNKYANKIQSLAGVAVAEFTGSLEDTIQRLILLADSVESSGNGAIATPVGVIS